MLLYAAPVWGQPEIFEQNATPFTVFQAPGVPYALPFLGGFNVPRPQFIDIDGDGDDDLFVQEKSNALMFFERVDAGGEVPYIKRSDAYQNLDIGEWYRFVDIDNDGDQDLFAEQPFSYIRLYENTGTQEAASFQLRADTLKDNEGAPLFAERQNILNLVDIDDDGLIDLFTGQLDGTITHYEQSLGTGIGNLTFSLQDRQFQDISIVSTFGKTAANEKQHGANTLTFFDVDGDGDLDLFWGDFFESGLLFFENKGSATNPLFTNDPLSFPVAAPVSTSGYNAPAFGDVDGDGEVDLVVGVLGGAFSALSSSADNLLYYKRNPAGQFASVNQRLFSNIDEGSDSYPVLYDIDLDQDLDLIVGNSIDPNDPDKANLTLFLNEGEPALPLFAAPVDIAIEPAFNYTPTFGDLNNDGYPDMVVGSFLGTMDLYWNAGSDGVPQFVTGEVDFLDIPSGSNSAPFLVDLDNDGDLDLLVGQSSGVINLFRNTGNAEAPVFVLETDRYADIDVGRRSAPVALDVDGDGDYDLIIGSDQDGLKPFRNVGSAEEPVFEAFEWAELEILRRMVPAIGDLDNDTDLDVLMGGLGGGLLYFENKRAEPTAVASEEVTPAYRLTSFPNPIATQGTIELKGGEAGPVSIHLFDSIGRDLGELYSGVYPGRGLRIPFSMGPYAAGVYLLRVSVGPAAIHCVVVKG